MLDGNLWGLKGYILFVAITSYVPLDENSVISISNVCLLWFQKSADSIAKVPTIVLSISYKGVKFIDAGSKVSRGKDRKQHGFQLNKLGFILVIYINGMRFTLCVCYLLSGNKDLHVCLHEYDLMSCIIMHIHI